MISFSRYKLIALILSVSGLIGSFSVLFLYFGGFERSISFDGGIRLSIIMPQDKSRQDIQNAASATGLPDPVIRLSSVKENKYDIELGPDVRDEISARIKKEEQAAIDRGEEPPGLTVAGEIEKKLLPELGISPEAVVSRETISAAYGSDLFGIAVQALLLTMVLIGLYLTFRFDFPFALGASVALLHDILFTVAFIGIARIEPSIPVVAAVLTIVGYSINDTIVIFDRIRSNIDDRSQAASPTIMDTAVNQTLSRTILTSLLTLISIVALIVGGATSLVDFALIILFGILIGTYSSIFVASPVVQVYEGLRLKFKRAA